MDRAGEIDVSVVRNTCRSEFGSQYPYREGHNCSKGSSALLWLPWVCAYVPVDYKCQPPHLAFYRSAGTLSGPHVCIAILYPLSHLPASYSLIHKLLHYVMAWAGMKIT